MEQKGEGAPPAGRSPYGYRHSVCHGGPALRDRTLAEPTIVKSSNRMTVNPEMTSVKLCERIQIHFTSLCRCPEKVQLHKSKHWATTGSESCLKPQIHKQVICFHVTPYHDEALCYSAQVIWAVVCLFVFCHTAIGTAVPQLTLVMM